MISQLLLLLLSSVAFPVASCLYFAPMLFTLCTLTVPSACLKQDGKSLLHHAAGAGHVEIVSFLLQNGVPVDEKSEVSVPGEARMMSS